MTAATILTMANLKGIDLLDPKAADIDFKALSEHLSKENRFNGATPDFVYCVADHLVTGTDAMLAAGATELEAGYFLLHDAHEGLWKDDPTPKKCAMAEAIEDACGVTAESILRIYDSIVDRLDAVIHEAAGLPWPMSEDCARVVKLYDKIMFVTEWRDLMGGIPHPDWTPYAGIMPLETVIKPRTWAWSQLSYMDRARKLLPALLLR